MDHLQHHLCIVLAHNDDESLRDLMEQLAALDCRIEQHGSAVEAFARMCLCHHAFMTAVRSEAGVGSADCPALVIVNPDQCPQLPSMLGASDRHLPMEIWQWHEGTFSQLRTGPSPNASPADIQAVPQPKPGGPPQLRLSEPFMEPESPGVVEWSDPLPALDDPSGAAEEQAHLTPQEIDMLLDARRPQGDAP